MWLEQLTTPNVTLQYIATRGLCHFAMGFWISFITALIIWVMLYAFNIIKIKTLDIPLSNAFQYLFIPLLAGFLGGIANNLVDCDHIVSFFGATNWRPLHPAALIVGCVGSFTYFVRIIALFFGFIPKNEMAIIRFVLLFIIFLSIASHAIEDYTINWW